MKESYDSNVFINCPFDTEYAPLLEAAIFTVYCSGFLPRTTKNINDCGPTRIEKITYLIENCQFGIHDLSRTELDEVNGLPRFNMPLELGLFLGAKRFGAPKHKSKETLILTEKPHAHQKYLSDIAGQDPESHYNEVKKLVTLIRDWLRPKVEHMPSGSILFKYYSTFRQELPSICHSSQLDLNELSYADFCEVVYQWIKNNNS